MTEPIIRLFITEVRENPDGQKVYKGSTQIADNFEASLKAGEIVWVGEFQQIGPLIKYFTKEA